MDQKKFGIIGTGNVGSAIAKQLIKQRFNVFVANSRGASSLQEFEQRTGTKAVNIAEITEIADFIFLCVPLKSVPSLKNHFETIKNATIFIDATNYIPQRDGAITEIDNGMPSSAWVSLQLGHSVVKAFNSIIASEIVTEGRPIKDKERIALPVAGNDRKARQDIMNLVGLLGFTAYDAGLLSDSWRQQPGTPAYCTDAKLNELPGLLSRANQKKAVINQQKSMEVMAKLSPDYPPKDLVRASRILLGLDLFKLKSWTALFRLVIAMQKKR